MEFIMGLLVGWFTTPYVLWGALVFLTGFPIFFWGYDIYEDRGWNYRFWRTVLFMFVTIAVLHIFTDFDAMSLITGGFWVAALNLWLYAVAYLSVGIAFSYLRFYFYAREYRKRMDERLARISDEKELKRQQDIEFKNRLSGYGSRVSLILKWILHWPWSALAWMLNDLLRDLCQALFDFGRRVFGDLYGMVARSTEPEWMKEREKAEKAAAAKK